jgi:hypothetical protein
MITMQVGNKIQAEGVKIRMDSTHCISHLLAE